MGGDKLLATVTNYNLEEFAQRNNVALVQFVHCMKATTFGSSFGEHQTPKIISMVKKRRIRAQFYQLGVKK